MPLHNLDGRWRYSKLLGQELNECIVRLPFDRWSSYLYLNPISIGAHDLVFRGFGLEVDFNKSFFHKASIGGRIRGLKESRIQGFSKEIKYPLDPLTPRILESFYLCYSNK